ncbi:hypothetical protein W97_04974 [Coniosporium apollinis CBS 100218]|uniref:DUF8035 domain-containing protein n=1 Tax=Coniosporium apollinis (strain CBS 100218) TaxID=1168221 RepID=R7YUX8_CONA1|nr:uncharacterized protein W97_04974 [Coniosporium apollinis CBS 100218]EON65735.1 hypothetical protein W97_04974 [Coniosporium apollinis CBS 100218]
MAARRYPTAELYDERQRDFYRGARSERDYDELDIELSHGRPDYGRRQPEFLREDYGRTAAGPLVPFRGREADERPPSRAPRREVETDEIIIRRREEEERPRARPPPPRSEVDRNEFMFRRQEREPPRRAPAETETTDIVIRRREEEEVPRVRARPREVEREELDISIRRTEQEERPRARPPPPRSEVDREEFSFRREEIERPRQPEEIRFRRGDFQERPRRAPMVRDDEPEVIFKHRERTGPGPDIHEDKLIIRPRSNSRPPPRELVAREREEFIVRRREPTPPPPPPPQLEQEEIIIRRVERERQPSPPPPPPEPEPIIRPPIHQEIITHHRHIDHGVIRARSPTPPPPPPSPPKDESLEIAIRRRGANDKFYDEDIIYERETRERKTRDREVELSRRRSLSAPRRRFTGNDIGAEAEYYNRKAMERAYVGEAYNGATKDWAIVDVPPGTNRVKMDGAGGGSQEITWQRYNGVRRSKFIAEDEVYDSGFGATPSGPPARARPRASDMWTEITKDLVIKDAIEEMGFDYEETEYFFYVMEYLRYEDVLQLVELSDYIRKDRRARIREIQYEREELNDRRRLTYDDHLVEREVIYDSRRRY